MRVLLLLALFALSGFAQATNNHNNEGCRGNCIQPQGAPSYDQDQGQSQGQHQGQVQGQDQGQAQGQSQSADATAVAGAIAVSGASADNTNLVSNRSDIDVGVSTADYNANSNRSENTNLNSNVALGGAGGEGGKGGSAFQGQSQSSDNSNSSNNSSSQSTSLTFESTGEATHYNKYGNNVNAFAPAIYSSSACTAGGISGAASALGVGVSLGGAKQDPQCQVRENARILAGLDTGMAIDYLCKNTKVDIGEVLGAACKYVPPVPTQPIVIPEPPVVSPPIQVVTDDVKGK